VALPTTTREWPVVRGPIVGRTRCAYQSRPRWTNIPKRACPRLVRALPPWQPLFIIMLTYGSIVFHSTRLVTDNCTEYNFHLTVAWDLHHQKAQATQNGHVAFERQNNCSKRRFRRLRCQIPIQRDGQIQYLLREGPTNVDCAIVIGSLVIAVFIVQLSHHSISHRRYGLNYQSVFRSSSTSCCDVNSFELV
jgi:hypothetical protein